MFARPRILLLVLWGLVASALPGQNLLEPQYIHLTIDNGLPSNNVFYVFQDSRRNMWFATDRGLAKFDGHKMATYSSRDGLVDNEVLELFEDSQGRIWPMASSGQICFYQNGRFYNGTNTDWLGTFRANNYASAWYEDKGGNVYIGFLDGRLIQIGRENRIKEYKYELPQNGVSIMEIGTDTGGRLVALLTPREFIYLDDPAGTLHTISDFYIAGNKNLPYKTMYTPQHQFEAVWGREWGHLGGNFKQFEHYPNPIMPSDHKSICLIQDRLERLWIGSTDGIHLMGPDRLKGGSKKHFLPGKQVSSMCMDHEGGYWFSTTKGVYYCPYPEIQHFNPPMEGTAPEVSAVYREPDGHVLAGFADGRLVRIAPDFSDASLAHPDMGNITRIHSRIPGEVWASGVKGTYKIIDGVSKQVVSRHFRAFGFTSPDTLCVCMNNWLKMGLDQIPDFFSRKVTKLTVSGPENRRCQALQVDKRGRLWVVNTDGMFLVEGGDTTYVKALGPWLKTGTVTCIETDDEGVWIGTNGNGILRYQDEKAQVFTSTEGLISDQVNWLEVDDHGDLWIATPNGLQWVDLNNPAGISTAVMSKAEGFPARSVQYVDVDHDTIFAATELGLLVFPVRLMDSTHVRPQPFLVGIKSGDQVMDLGTPLQLEYAQNELQVQFNAISFRKAGALSYRYRLKGLEEAWHLGAADIATYSAIPNGQYEFEVQTRAANGPWSPAAAFAVEVFPPFWKEIWFVLLVAFAGLALLALSFYLVIRTIRQRNAVRQRIMQAEHQALITQMNPHFIFNSLNSIQRFFLSHNPETANDYLADFSALIRAILEIGREAEITLARELEFLRLYIHLEALRLDNQFKYEITLDPGVAPHQTKIPPMFIQPFVENAIWHGLAPKSAEGRLTLNFRREDAYLVCTVRDDGIGRKRAGELKAQSKRTYKSLATKITEERLELFNKTNKFPIRLDIRDLFDAQGQSIGTEVSVKFPILTHAKS